MVRYLVMAVVLCTARVAWPCSIALPHFAVDESEVGVDTQPPAKPVVTVTNIGRAEGDGWIPLFGGDSCSDIAGLTLSVSSADDRTASAELGWKYRVVSGAFRESDRAQGAWKGTLSIIWSEQSTPPIDAVLAIVAVDRAGNESAPTEVVIQDPGDTGCASVGAPGMLFAFGLVALRRRRA